jgi:glycosyltransferase involved in cell wall biosynthesis
MHIVLLQFYSSTPTPDYEVIASELRARGHAVWLATPNESGDLEWNDGTRIVAIQPGPIPLSDAVLRARLVASVLRRARSIRFMLRVRGALRAAPPDVVQVNPTLGAFVLPLFMPRHIRFILDIRHPSGAATDLVGKLRDRLAIRTWQICSRHIYHHACFVSEPAARSVLGKNWPRWGSVIPLAIDQRFLTFDRARPASENHKRPARFVYIGTLSRYRSLERILLAVQRMLQQTSEFQVDFVGPDEANGYYHNLVSELKLDSVVAIKPRVPYRNIPEVVSSYDVALAYIPSFPEWLHQPTLKILEYRALGMPILATDFGSNREVVENGINGLLVQDSVEGLAEGMLRFITDQDFLNACSANARIMRRGTTFSEVADLYEQTVYSPTQTTRNEENAA